MNHLGFGVFIDIWSMPFGYKTVEKNNDLFSNRFNYPDNK